ncbi:MAG: sodium:proton antiporter [Candidatus Eisenbacteria bacterium]
MKDLGESLPLYSILPFAALLLAIAILPLLWPHPWERLKNKAIVAWGLALPVAIWFLRHDASHLAHTGLEYLAFIALLGSLYVISGGILFTGDLRATPLVNTAFLAVGGVLANLIGTTGASMLLIRPLLETNMERERKQHIPIFFIFVVSNVGGCLTPLGDPPLFLGFLRGVPFTWTFGLFPEWLLMMGLLLVTFFAIDSLAVRRETRAALRLDRAHQRKLHLAGTHNFLYLAGVLGAVFLPVWPRIGAMLGLAWLSLATTKRWIHDRNRFSFYPIQEVAILFAGIFVAMIPALLILEARGASFGIREPWQFFWLTGGLSTFLDNAPTYLTFASLALGLHGLGEGAGHAEGGPLLALIHHGDGEQLLRAISLGAVFMGANSYIGNGPNFMVKAIAEERKVAMPSFFGYMAWSVAILVPMFLPVT